MHTACSTLQLPLYVFNDQSQDRNYSKHDKYCKCDISLSLIIQLLTFVLIKHKECANICNLCFTLLYVQTRV